MENDKKIICEDIEGKKYEVSINQLAFRPSVYGIIIQDDKILLSRQWDGYDFPGGGINLGETVDDALKREVKEETGFDANPDKIITCETSFFKLPFTEKYVHSIHLYYLCKITGGELSTEFFDNDEKQYANKAEWIALKNTNKIKFCNSADSLKIIEKAKTIL